MVVTGNADKRAKVTVQLKGWEARVAVWVEGIYVLGEIISMKVSMRQYWRNKGE